MLERQLQESPPRFEELPKVLARVLVGALRKEEEVTATKGRGRRDVTFIACGYEKRRARVAELYADSDGAGDFSIQTSEVKAPSNDRGRCISRGMWFYDDWPLGAATLADARITAASVFAQICEDQRRSQRPPGGPTRIAEVGAAGACWRQAQPEDETARQVHGWRA